MSTRKLALVLFALCATLLPALSWADSQVRIVRLSYVEGDVQIDRRDGRGFGRAFLNMPVVSGARLRTGDDARAEVEFEQGSTVRILPAARIEFTELSRRDSGEPSTFIELQQGTAYFNLHKKDGQQFAIAVGPREIRPPKSARFRLQLQGKEARLAVSKGELKVAANAANDWISVGKNETLTLNLDDASRTLLAKEVAPDPYDEWDKERNEYRERYGSDADLRAHGNFIYVPPYGYLWRPARASSLWDPFAHGAWVWYPGFGYTWVSGYAWGWTPYHYGSWLFVPIYGWCWNPRGGTGNWNNAPTVGDPPSGYNPPRPPSSGGGGVVIVGRGPAPASGPGGRRPALDTDAAGAPGRRAAGPNSSGPRDDSVGNLPDGGEGRVGRGPSGTSNAGAPSAPPPSRPSAPPSSIGGGGSSRPSAPAGGSGSGSRFGGSHSSGGSHSGHGGSQPRTNVPR
ncbi:MAG: FecR family protein [Acidobacteriales bacterium]|nr:FecR family protein [Terriglobales bacterium]